MGIDSNRRVRDFDVRVAVDQGRPALSVAGQLDAHSAGRFEELLTHVIESTTQDVVVGLAGLESIGSAGVGAFRRAVERLRVDERELIVRSPTPAVYRALDVAGVTPTVRIERS